MDIERRAVDRHARCVPRAVPPRRAMLIVVAAQQVNFPLRVPRDARYAYYVVARAVTIESALKFRAGVGGSCVVLPGVAIVAKARG